MDVHKNKPITLFLIITHNEMYSCLIVKSIVIIIIIIEVPTYCNYYYSYQ